MARGFSNDIKCSFIFYSMKKKADYIYRAADEIVAVSETYAQRAVAVHKKLKKGHVIFLGTDLDKFDQELKKNRNINKPDNEIWIGYVGTLGHSYDLSIVFEALEQIKIEKKINNVKFIVMGDGPLKSKFEAYAISKNIDAKFLGRLPYAQMVGILGVCDIAINPIIKGAAASIINKHGDYAAAGLPVINTQESIEYRKLVDTYKMGLNCNNNDSDDLAKKITLLLANEDLRITMGKNSRRLAEELFDRRITYMSILQVIEKICDYNE